MDQDALAGVLAMQMRQCSRYWPILTMRCLDSPWPSPGQHLQLDHELQHGPVDEWCSLVQRIS